MKLGGALAAGTRRTDLSGSASSPLRSCALGGFPSTGLYSASKFALEGLSEALAMEAAGFGVKVSIVQPGGYWTDLCTAMRSPLEAYAPLRAELEKQFAKGSVDSDPKLAAEALLQLVDGDEPPLRLLLGSMVYDLAFDIARKRMDTWAAWEHVSRAAEHVIPAPQFTAEEAGNHRREAR